MNDWQRLGLPPRDIKTHQLLCHMKAKVQPGESGEKFCVTPINGSGDYIDQRPTDHYFVLVNGDCTIAEHCRFVAFRQDGQEWSGVAISPPNGYSSRFTEENRWAAMLANDFKGPMFNRPWTAVIENTLTGEIYELDPGGQNGDGLGDGETGGGSGGGSGGTGSGSGGGGS